MMANRQFRGDQHWRNSHRPDQPGRDRGPGLADQPELVVLHRCDRLQRLSRHTTGGENYGRDLFRYSNTSYNDTGLSGGTTYFYTAKATNDSGTSVASSEAKALTAPGSVTAGP